MQNFKSYLSELHGKSSLSQKLFDIKKSDNEGIANFWMPMSSAQMKQITPTPPRITCWHIAAQQFHKTMFKGENKKRGISAFLNMSATSLARGVATSGAQVIYELEADLLGSFSGDIGSEPDNSGRRWYEMYELARSDTYTDKFENTKVNLKDLGTMPADMEKYVISAIERVWGKKPNNKGESLTMYWQLLPDELKHKNRSGELADIIKGYIEAATKTYKKNAKALAKKIQSHYNADQMPAGQWDEVIVNNYKIRQVHMTHEMRNDMRSGVRFEWDKAEDWIETKLGKEIEMHDKNQDLAIEISRINANMRIKF